MDGPLARLGAAALAPEAGPLTGDDIHLEIGRVTFRAVEAVIAAGVVGAAVGLQLIKKLKDVKGHCHPSRTTVAMAVTPRNFCLTSTVGTGFLAFF